MSSSMKITCRFPENVKVLRHNLINRLSNRHQDFKVVEVFQDRTIDVGFNEILALQQFTQPIYSLGKSEIAGQETRSFQRKRRRNAHRERLAACLGNMMIKNFTHA
ncbi:hypothetical protein VL15_02360 [Burkholderia cepacia]|uniref:Uncharacterized protein n=1 Tax=Burkholderia cepacia TaxID=292 RepID=A0A0J5X6B9_BURCE|nr:hypothetical protein VL15_02360 [Burkholderia cepacia]